MSDVTKGIKIYRGKTAAKGQYGVIDDRRRLETGNFIYELGAHPGIITRVCTLAMKDSDKIQSFGYDTLENGVIQHYDEALAGTVASGNASGGAAKADTLYVKNMHLWMPDTTWFNVNTGEQILVKTVAPIPSSETAFGYDSGHPEYGKITVSRNYTNDTQFSAKAVSKGDRWQYTGPAAKEAGEPGIAQATVVKPVRNGMRRFTHTFEMSDVLAMTKSGAFYGMSERERLERDMRYKAIWDEEAAMLDGQFAYEYPGKTAGGVYGNVLESGVDSWRGSTRGLLPTIHAFAPGNIYDCNGVLSYRLFCDFFSYLTDMNPGGMQKMVKKSGSTENTVKNSYIILCGSVALTALTDLLHSKVQTMVGEDHYGFDMKRIETPYGTAHLRRHIQLDGPRADWMVWVDPKRMGQKVYAGFDNRFKKVSTDEKYTMKWDLQKIAGLWIGNAELFGVLKGVQAAV